MSEGVMSFDDIIAKVKEHPELWQSGHPFYRHRVVSAKTWKQIAAELKADEILVRKRWKHLKDQHRKEHKKVESGIMPKSFWHYYNDLLFLWTETTYNESVAATEASDNEGYSNGGSDSDDAPLKAKKRRKARTERTPSSPSQMSPNGTTAMQSLITKSPDSGRLNFILHKLNALDELIESRNQVQVDHMSNDSDYMFILSLLPIMKKLTDIQKLQFRGKMNDWLLTLMTQNEYTNCYDYNAYQNDNSNLVKKRWKHLKDTFRKEIKKMATNQVALSSWIHYNEMEFLTDEITKKPQQKKESEGESESESEADDKPLKRAQNAAQKRRHESTVTSRMDAKKQSSIKFKKIMRSLNTLSKSIEKSTSGGPDEHLKNDTDYMFLVSLLPTMHHLTDVQRLQFRGKINNWLLNALVENEYPNCDSKMYLQMKLNDVKPDKDNCGYE